jgi:hypothetical protein
MTSSSRLPVGTSGLEGARLAMLNPRSISSWIPGGCCRVPGLVTVTACRFGTPDLTRGSWWSPTGEALGETIRESRTPGRDTESRKIWNSRSEVLQVVKKEKELLHGDNSIRIFFLTGESGDAEIDVDAIVRTVKLGDATRKYQKTPTESLTTQFSTISE